MKKIVLVTCVAALLAAPAMAQVDFSRYVALGDSITAGYVGGGLMDYYQNHTYPARLARQAGTGTFEMPLISPPGLGPVLVLESLSPLSIAPTDVPPPADPFDYFYNVTLEAPYQNLAVPGANTEDVLTQTGNVLNLIAGNFDNVMPDLILRTPQVEDPTTGELVDYTALVGAITQQPTLVTVWIGNNDFLGAVVAATPIDGVTMTPLDEFTVSYNQMVGALATSLPNAEIVVFTVVGDTGFIPFATTVPNMVDVPGVGTVQLVGEEGPVTDDDYLTLAASALVAQGYGLPIPGSPPLPENLNPATGDPGVILRADEIAAIDERMDALNQIIYDATSHYSNVHVFDVNETIGQLASGTYRSFGGVELSMDFLVGGIISYDGVHPQNVGHGVVAYELIEFLNDELGAGLPQINMWDVLNEGDWQASSSFAAVCGGCDPKQVVFTPDAFMELYELMLPEMAARMKQRPQELARPVAAD